MKRIFLFAALLTVPTILTPQTDCLSQTKQLKEPYDHKVYGPVACTCPCDKYRAEGLQSADRNECLICLHYHDPQPFIFLTKISYRPTPLWTKWHKTPRHLIQGLINRYRTEQLTAPAA